jgi:hypothetical protein
VATAFGYRIILIVPAAKVAAVVSWFQANVGASAVDPQLGPALNPSGLPTDPVTHRWCCGAWVEADAKKILVKLCQLAGVAPPTAAQWDNATRAQKISWLHSVQAAIWSGYGAWVTLAGNDDVWDDAGAALAAAGVAVQASAGV